MRGVSVGFRKMTSMKTKCEADVEAILDQLGLADNGLLLGSLALIQDKTQMSGIFVFVTAP